MNIVARRAALAAGLLGLFASGMGADRPDQKPGAATREFDLEGFHVRVDATRQVIGIDVPEERGYSRTDRAGREDVPVSPTLGATEGFVSGSILAQKAKQFDDGLYAAVELAAQNGAGRFSGKTGMLARLARAMATAKAERSGNVPTVVLAACRLGGVHAEVPAGMDAETDSAIALFDADSLRSKPIAFYTWSSALSAIFRQDRMLQTELNGDDGIVALVRAIHSDSDARATYERYLALVSRLTNPLTSPDLLGPLHSLEKGRSELPPDRLFFFPASRSYETDLVKKLYTDKPIPEGFNLVEEMVRRIRSGKLDLAPKESSGWYDYQTWAIEPLVAPERTAEAARLDLDASYRKQLEALFKGILTLTRETHIKQLEIPAPGERPFGREREPVKIHISPELSVEPLATYYARRAASYRFVRSVLVDTFGKEALGGLHRQTATGPVQADLATELDRMEAIFAGASAMVCQELGLAEAVSASPVAPRGRSADADREAFGQWARSIATDTDVGLDARMMVPVFFDLGRRMTKVWVFLGWSMRPVHFRFATVPSVEITKDRQAVKANLAQVEFGDKHSSLAYPVTAEVYVQEILERDEFRRHCDRYKTRAEILKHLK
jgi:hypothetical protein